MSFEEVGIFHKKNVVSLDLLEHLSIQFSMLRKGIYFYNNIPDDNINKHHFGDVQVKNSFCQYSTIFSESLLLQMLPVVEEIVGNKILPSYSYSRIYYKDACMPIHVDRSSCEISATFTIKVDKDNPYPIYFIDKKGREIEIVMDPGDLVVYKGCELQHWRNNFTGNDHMQTFLHYIFADGQYKNLLYDSRPFLGLPKSTRKR